MIFIFITQLEMHIHTQRQEKELAAIMKKRNSAGWKLISTSTAIVDTKTCF